MPGPPGVVRSILRARPGPIAWLETIDPGAQRRVKGLRLVTAYGLAAMLGAMPQVRAGLPHAAALSSLAGGFALWGSVSEARSTRFECSRDLALLALAAGCGALAFAALSAMLHGSGGGAREFILVSGAFCVGYLRRFGITGTGIGSQLYIGQLLAYTAGLGLADWPTIAAAVCLAAIGSAVPRLLSGPAEHPQPPAPLPGGTGWIRPELAMGLQAAAAALVIAGLNAAFGLVESAWAITASTYVVAGSARGTVQRVARRILGTAIGVPLGLAFLPLTVTAPLAVWTAAALAMMVYAVALPERYDVACGAYAFTLVVTLAISGEHALPLLVSRAWETLLGGIIGMGMALALFPLRAPTSGPLRP